MPLTDEFVLAAYVDGSDLESVAAALKKGFSCFLESGAWQSDSVLLVDQKQPDEEAESGFLPQWDLGVNLGLDHMRNAPRWFDGVEALVTMLHGLSAETGRTFVMFLCFQSEPWRQEHLAFIGSDADDTSYLREFIARLTGL